VKSGNIIIEDKRKWNRGSIREKIQRMCVYNKQREGEGGAERYIIIIIIPFK